MRRADVDVRERDAALEVLARHRLRAHFYLPAAGIEDQELASALQCLGDRGYIITTEAGSLVGKTAAARLSSNEKADLWRSTFKIVSKD